MPQPAASHSRGNDATRRVFAWAKYDWANSAYATLSITLLVNYILNVVFPQKQYGTRGAVVWALGISASMFIAAILSPIVGAMADAHASKRRWLAATAALGATSSILLDLVPPSSPWIIVGLFFLASLFFELSLGVYNGFLPEIATHDDMNRVSAWGYGLGYIGGGLALVLAVLLIKLAPSWGVNSLALQLRMGLVLMGAWWGLFSLPTILLFNDARPPDSRAFAATARSAGRAA